MLGGKSLVFQDFRFAVGVVFEHQLSVDRLEIERNDWSVRFLGNGQLGSRGIRGRLVKNPVDLHIGQRVRHRRWLLGMTQQQLAQAVGIRFQQIQKYESGANRISASRLWDLAKALDMPISFFFEGLGTGKDGQAGDDGLLQNKETMDLIRAYYGLDEGPRRRLLELAKALSGADLHKV